MFAISAERVPPRPHRSGRIDSSCANSGRNCRSGTGMSF